MGRAARVHRRHMQAQYLSSACWRAAAPPAEVGVAKSVEQLAYSAAADYSGEPAARGGALY